MSIVTPQRPPGSEVPPDPEALDAVIEEARRRARRRRRGYAAGAIVAAAAGLLAFYGFNRGGGATRPQARAEQPAAAAAALARGDWRPAPGLEGGAVSAIAFDGKNPETVFAATLRGGVVKSSDGGGSWRALDIGPSMARFDALAVAPRDPQTVYAGGDRIFKSTDGGATWKAVHSGLFEGETEAARQHRRLEGLVYALAVDPTNPEVVYAGTWTRGVLKTTNGGANWRRIFLGGVNALVLDPQDRDTLYAGAKGGGVFKSSNGGQSWHPVGLEGTNVGALALDPRHPRTIYAGTYRKGVFKSTDGGASWRATGLQGGDVRELMLDPQEPENVYALSDGRIFLSRDGGEAWRALDAGWASGTSASTLAINPRDPATVYVGTSSAWNAFGASGVFKTVDGGDSWRPMNAGLTDARVSALALDPRSPGTAYAAVDGRGVFKRVDGSWRAASTGLTPASVSAYAEPAVAVDPQDPETVYAGLGNGVFKSTDGGASWRASLTPPAFGPVPIRPAVVALAIDSQNPTTVYAIAADHGMYPQGEVVRTYESRVFKSTDGGRTWSTGAIVQRVHVPDGAFARGVRVPVAPGLIVAQAVRTSPLAIDPLAPETLYAGGLGVRKSVDGGITWQGAGLTRRLVLALAVDPKETAVVYAGTDAGLFKSTNAGASWQPVRGALDGVRVEALAIDPEQRQTVYAGTDSGVFWTADGGHSWRRFTRLPRRAFDALAVDPTAGIVYAGSNGGGIFELKLSP
jgi:photosystem II stability/assembly factor-like uncharacterized protein